MPRKKKVVPEKVDHEKICFTYLAIIKKLIAQTITLSANGDQLWCMYKLGQKKIELQLGPDAKINELIDIIFNMLVLDENAARDFDAIWNK
jgi:hypothetical protein